MTHYATKNIYFAYGSTTAVSKWWFLPTATVVEDRNDEQTLEPHRELLIKVSSTHRGILPRAACRAHLCPPQKSCPCTPRKHTDSIFLWHLTVTQLCAAISKAISSLSNLSPTLPANLFTFCIHGYVLLHEQARRRKNFQATIVTWKIN